MLGVTTPAIGPTVEWWWHGSSDTPVPDSKSATASSGSSTRPSSAAPAISPPRSGPDARSQSIGGPACRNSPRWRPSTSAAGATSTSVAVTSSIAASARSLARAPQRVGRDRGEVGLGAGHRRPPVDPGRPAVAWAATASASRSAPTLTTLSGVVIGVPPTSSSARRVAPALDRCTSAPARPARATWRSRPCGSPSVPTTATTTGWSTPASAGASSAAGSGSAPWPSTTSSSSTPVAGSAAARARCSSRRRRVDHRVRAARRVLVVAEVDEACARPSVAGDQLGLALRACRRRRAHGSRRWPAAARRRRRARPGRRGRAGAAPPRRRR